MEFCISDLLERHRTLEKTRDRHVWTTTTHGVDGLELELAIGVQLSIGDHRIRTRTVEDGGGSGLGEEPPNQESQMSKVQQLLGQC